MHQLIIGLLASVASEKQKQVRVSNLVKWVFQFILKSELQYLTSSSFYGTCIYANMDINNFTKF